MHMKIICYRVNPPRQAEVGFYLDYAINCFTTDGGQMAGSFSINFSGDETVAQANKAIVDASTAFARSNGVECVDSDVWHDPVAVG